MDVKAGRYTANYPDDFVVFFIGMRINELWRVHEWVPVMRAAFAMNKELEELPDTPLLESRTLLTVVRSHLREHAPDGSGGGGGVAAIIVLGAVLVLAFLPAHPTLEHTEDPATSDASADRRRALA